MKAWLKWQWWALQRNVEMLRRMWRTDRAFLLVAVFVTLASMYVIWQAAIRPFWNR